MARDISISDFPDHEKHAAVLVLMNNVVEEVVGVLIHGGGLARPAVEHESGHVEKVKIGKVRPHELQFQAFRAADSDNGRALAPHDLVHALSDLGFVVGRIKCLLAHDLPPLEDAKHGGSGRP